MNYNHKLSKYKYKFNNTNILDKKLIYMVKIGQYINQKGSGIFDGQIQGLVTEYKKLNDDIDKKIALLNKINVNIKRHDDLMSEIFTGSITKYNAERDGDIIQYYINLNNEAL